MSMLEQNILLWNRQYPDAPLTRSLCEEQTGASAWYTEAARDGSLIDKITWQGSALALQSQYRPLEEARRFVKQYEEMKPGSCILFLGMGNGYLLRELAKLPDVTVVCYEPSLSYFCHVLCQYALEDVLTNPNLHIYIAGLNADTLALAMYHYVHALNWPIFYLDFMPKYQQLYPEAVAYVEDVYEKSRMHAIQNYSSANRFAKQEMQNAVRNLRYIYTGYSIAQFQNRLRDVPVIMVAAGPSLEKNVEQLKQYRDRAFIICVDHAIPMLARHGITPHAYMTVDAAKDPSMFEQAGDAPCFVYTTSNPAALQKLKHPKLIFASTLYAYASHLFEIAGSELFELESGGSVAINAVHAALYMGSRTIMVIGQDLALTGNRLYAGVETEDLAQEHDLLSVKAFDGGEVLTRTDYKAYIDFYEAFTAHRKDVTFVNTTEGGAYIPGMLHMPLAEAMERYGLPTPFDGDRLLEDVPVLMTEETQMRIAQEYHGLMRYFETVRREVGSVIASVERGIGLLEKTSYANPELVKVEQKMNTFQELYYGHPGMTILSMGLAREVQEALIDVAFTQEEPTQELLRLYRKMLRFFQGIQTCVTEAIPLLQEVLEEIKQPAG